LDDQIIQDALRAGLTFSFSPLASYVTVRSTCCKTAGGSVR